MTVRQAGNGRGNRLFDTGHGDATADTPSEGNASHRNSSSERDRHLDVTGEAGPPDRTIAAGTSGGAGGNPSATVAAVGAAEVMAHLVDTLSGHFAECHETLQLMVDASGEMSRILDDVLMIQKIQAGEQAWIRSVHAVVSVER